MAKNKLALTLVLALTPVVMWGALWWASHRESKVITQQVDLHFSAPDTDFSRRLAAFDQQCNPNVGYIDYALLIKARDRAVRLFAIQECKGPY